MNNYLLEAQNITKKYKNSTVIEDICLSISSGECLGLLGVNGSGKTTLLDIISGKSKPNTGTVSILEADTLNRTALKSPKSFANYIGYVPQENPLIEDMTVYENLKLWYCDSKYNLNDMLKNGFLNKLGIHEYLNKRVCKISGGMKKKLSIGIALATDPSFLVLDEPCAALDIIAKNSIRDYLVDYKKNGGGVIISTHDEEDLEIIDRLFLLKKGILTEISPSIRGRDLVNIMLDLQSKT